MSATGVLALLRLAAREQPLAACRAALPLLIGKRLRATNRLRQILAGSTAAYRFWLQRAERRQPQSLLGAEAHSTSISLVIDDWNGDGGGGLAETLRSIGGQVGMPGQLIVASRAPPPVRLGSVEGQSHGPAIEHLHADPEDPAGFQALLAAIRLDRAIMVRSGDQLAPTAIFRFAAGLADLGTASIVYADEDRLGRDGLRQQPWFKPCWDADLFLMLDYLTGACAVRVADLRDTGEMERGWSGCVATLALRGVGPERLAPAPPLISRPLGCDVAQHARHAELINGLLGAAVRRTSDGSLIWPLSDPHPLVSIVIPSRDNLAYLERCVTSIRQHTSYKPFEILIVDNGSTDPRTLVWMEDIQGPGTRVLRHPGPFNFSAINNAAVKQADGNFVCLLNDDTEVVDGKWLELLVRQALRPGVGAVGARLLYPDGRLQHAGVVIGIGGAAGHVHRFGSPDSTPLCPTPHLAQQVSAVTGACMLVSREAYAAIGGLDEQAFPVAFNDVDFCLRLAATGLRCIYEPAATLVHHESVSRGLDSDPANRERFRREEAELQLRWSTRTWLDPHYSPSLSRRIEQVIVDI